MNNKKIVEYDILRVIVTLLVVIGHCGYYVTFSYYGGCDYSSYAQNLSPVYKIFQNITDFIYLFHMPLFMALSGALYYVSQKNGKYKTFSSLAANKAKRLIIPFFIVTAVWSAPLKLLTGYYSESDNIIKDIFIGQILNQGNTHLWFLLALFFIFLIVWFLNKLNVSKLFILFILFTLHLLSSLFTSVIIMNITANAVWFYIGFLFEENRESYKRHITKLNTAAAGILLVLCNIVNKRFIPAFLNYDLSSMNIMLIFSALLGMIFTFNLCCLIQNSKFCHSGFFKLLSRDSFGIYLYSDSLNYVVLYISAQCFGSVIYSDNICSMVYILARICVTLFLPILISELLRKLNIKYIV